MDCRHIEDKPVIDEVVLSLKKCVELSICRCLVLHFLRVSFNSIRQKIFYFNPLVPLRTLEYVSIIFFKMLITLFLDVLFFSSLLCPTVYCRGILLLPPLFCSSVLFCSVRSFVIYVPWLSSVDCRVSFVIVTVGSCSMLLLL